MPDVEGGGRGENPEEIEAIRLRERVDQLEATVDTLAAQIELLNKRDEDIIEAIRWLVEVLSGTHNFYNSGPRPEGAAISPRLAGLIIQRVEQGRSKIENE